jgi:OmpA-OmpF porin, OOP family
MALNILDYLNDQFSSSVIDQLADRIDETPVNTRKALRGALPAVVGGLAHRVQNGGADTILNALKSGQFSKETTPIDAAQVTDTREETQKAVETGREFVGTILGANTDRITQSIAEYGEIQPASARSVMGLVGSVLMGMLGRQYQEQGLSDTNLKTLLLGQTDSIKAALPAGLSSVGELLGFDQFQTPTGPPTEVQGTDHFSGTPLNPNIPKSTDGERQKENVRWLRWVMVVIGILIIGLIVQKCREPQNSTDGVYTDTTRRVESDAVEDRSPATQQNVRDSHGQVSDSTAPGALGIRDSSTVAPQRK